MTPSPKRGRRLRGLLIGAVLIWVGYRWRAPLVASGLLQWQAIGIVAGGTLVALLVSYPLRLLAESVAAVYRGWTAPRESPERMVQVFAEWASRAKRSGMMAVEREIRSATDPFLARALTQAVSGADASVVRQTLDVDHRVSLERDEERAQVLESAGGYAPTLGVIAAVLGLMRAMQDLSSPAHVGHGIAAAFVATLYGLGLANLVFLPLATRLRTQARRQALQREFTIDGVMALHAGLHPRLVEERLNGYVSRGAREAGVA